MPNDPFFLVNPLTGARAELLDSPAEMDGSGFRLEWTLPPHRGREPLPHLHSAWTERFEIVAGQGLYQLDGVDYPVHPGATLHVPRGTNHLHPWSTDDAGLRFHQISVFDQPTLRAIDDTFAAFATWFRLMNEGRTNSEGIPRNPLWLAVILDALQRHGSYVRLGSPRVQRAITLPLAALAHVLGYQIDQLNLGLPTPA